MLQNKPGKHVHKYERVKMGKDKSFIVYKCALPGCTHYIQETFIQGKIALCWRCNEEFVIGAKVHRKPLCPSCTKKLPLRHFETLHGTRSLESETLEDSEFLDRLLRKSGVGTKT